MGDVMSLPTRGSRRGTKRGGRRKSRGRGRGSVIDSNVEVIPVGDISSDEDCDNIADAALCGTEPSIGVLNPTITELGFSSGPSAAKRSRGKSGRGKSPSGRGRRGAKRGAGKKSSGRGSGSVIDYSNIEVIPVGDISSDEDCRTNYTASTVPCETAPSTNSLSTDVLNQTDDLELGSDAMSCVDVSRTLIGQSSANIHRIENTNDPLPASLSCVENNPSNVSETEDVPPPKPVLKKKTTKRGLARKTSDTSVSTSSDITNITSRDVYSKRVNTMKLLYEDNETSEALKEAATPEPVTPVAVPTKEADDSLLVCSQGSDISSLVDLSDDESRVKDTPRSSRKPAKRRSPTPPPVPAGDGALPRPKSKRMNKKLNSAFKALQSAQTVLETQKISPIFTNPRNRQKRHFSDVLTGDEDSPKKSEMDVKVRYLSRIHKINMQLTDPLHVLVSKMSKELEEPEHQLYLYHRDQPLSLKSNLQQSGLTVADILECYCIKTNTEEDTSDETIELFVQCSSKRTKVAMSMNKREPLAILSEKYAKQMKLGDVNLKLFVDGDPIELKDTPDKLDLEDGDILDVMY